MIELRPYVIRQGDYLARLAHLYRFDAEQVWHFPENTALRDKRRSPDILYPGDILHIPVTAACGVAVRAQSQQSYSAAVPCIDVTLTIHEAGTPLPGAICEVSGLPGRGADVPAQYLTDAHGIVVLSVPVVLREIEIYVAAQHTTYRIQIGNLDPVDEVMGVTKRLHNLGYLDEDDGLESESADEVSEFDDLQSILPDAIAAFQVDNGLAVTATADQAFRDQLIKVHGC